MSQLFFIASEFSFFIKELGLTNTKGGIFDWSKEFCANYVQKENGKNLFLESFKTL